MPSREIAVLFRINAQSEAYEQALAKAGVPYVLRGAERFFERPEVRQAVVLLRGAARSAGRRAAGRRGPPHPGGRRPDARRRPAAARPARSGSRSRPWPTWPRTWPPTGADLPAFVAELERRASEQHAPPVEGVTLASLHAAKGLEWDAVFLVGLTDGMMPIIYAETPEQIEEERRLLYVGVTRAREHLSLSWALARAPGGRQSRRPSRFLDGLTGRARRLRRARRRPPANVARSRLR